MIGLIKDPGFDINRTEEYKLSIQVSLDGFSFSVVHAHKKQLLALHVFPFELSSSKFLGRHFKEWVQKNEILQAKYHSTSIIYCSESLTFIPSELYDSNYPDAIGRLVFGNQNGNDFTGIQLNHASGNLVFPVPENLLDILKQLFPEQKLIHPATVLDNELGKLSDSNQSTMALYFCKKFFTLFLYVDSRLKAVNSYNYTNAGDVTYFSVTALKKFKTVPGKTTLFLAGEATPKGEIHENLKKVFMRTIFFVPEVQYDSYIFKEPLHRFIVLF